MFKGFAKDNVHFKLFAIATPIIVQNLVQYLQLQVDMAMLGQSNSLFLSAVGNVLYPYNIIISFLTALSTGATVLISHSLGSRSLRSAQRYSEVSFFFNLLVAIPFFFLLFFLAQELMNLMGTSEQISRYATEYMKYLSFSVLFLGVALSIVAILQGMGKTRAIMIAAIIGTVANIFFDWVLIYGKLGFPVMGIKGAAIATSIANFLGMVYLIIAFVTTKRLPFKPNLKGLLYPRWKIQRRNVVVGLPYGLEAMFWSFGQIIIVRLVNEVDDFAVGLYVLISRIQAVTFFFYLGIAKATMILVGQEMGAGNRKGALRVSFLSLKYAFATCLIAATLFIIYPAQLLSLFSSDEALIKESIVLLNIVSITIFPVAINVVIGNAIRGMKDTKWMFYTQTFGTIFVISLSSLLLLYFHLDLKGVFLTILFDEVIRAFLNYRRFNTYVAVR
ncbi:MAG: MATE family efflux transporter [Prolixibacteraceae bacterium]